jgi:hypothetical protein
MLITHKFDALDARVEAMVSAVIDACHAACQPLHDLRNGSAPPVENDEASRVPPVASDSGLGVQTLH